MPKLRAQRRIDQPYSPISSSVVAISGGGVIATSILAGDGIGVNGQEVSVDATVARTTTDMVAGAGLTGGGTLAASRTFAVGAGDGVSVAADAVAVDSTVVRTTRALTAGSGLTGGGTLAADRSFTVGEGDGITVGASTVAVDASDLVSGDYGLEVVSNDVRVDLATNSGLAFATGLALGTPGAATATSTSAVTTSTHTHAVTASADPGTAISLLKTATGGSFAFGTDLLYIDNATKNVGINVTPDGGAALKVVSENNGDITVNIKQKSGQTARLWKVEDSAGQELIVLDSQGNLQSGNPGFVSGLLGWQIGHTGNAEFNNIVARGELHASIFVVDEFSASGGTLVVAPAGKLENDMTLHTTTGTTDDIVIRSTAIGDTDLDIRTTSGTFSGTTLAVRWLTNYLDITDPPAGHALVFSPGDVLRCKTIMGNGGIDLYDVWFRVNSNNDQSAYWRYYVSWIQGGADGITIPAGAAIISYGQEGDGRILLTADQNTAPYIDVFNVGPDPWSGESGSVIPRTRIGRLDGVGLPAVSGIEQYGIVSSTDLSDASAPYFVASNLGLSMYRVDLTLSDGTNQTAQISAGGRVRLGTDIANEATRGFEFDPMTGNLLIGQNTANHVEWTQATGIVNIAGAITITGGSGYASLTDIPTALADINGTEGTKLTGIADGATVGAAWGTNLTGRPTELTDGRVSAGLNSSGHVITKVLPGSTVGTPAGAGLYLGSDKMGYYSGSAWRTYMANDGKFYFAGTGGAGIAWDLTDLYGTDGSTVQWYARASTGKLYAGAGAVWLDALGMGLNVYSTISLVNDPDLYSVRWHDGATKVGSVGMQKVSSFSDYYMVINAVEPSGSAYDVAVIIQAIPDGGGGPQLLVHSVDGIVASGLPTTVDSLLFSTGGKALSFRTTAF